MLEMETHPVQGRAFQSAIVSLEVLVAQLVKSENVALLLGNFRGGLAVVPDECHNIHSGGESQQALLETQEDLIGAGGDQIQIPDTSRFVA